MTLVCEGLVVGGRADRPPTLDAVSLVAETGDIIGVVGPARAGKSVLLEALAGERPVSRGAVRLDGVPVADRRARCRIGFAASPPLLPPDLTGWEWLAYVASHRVRDRGERRQRVRWAAELSGLGGEAASRLRRCDRATVFRVAFAAAAVAGSRLIVLDEPLTGRELRGGADLRAATATLAAAGRMVMIGARDVGTVEQVATRALVLSQGQVAADVHMAALVRERVLELALDGTGLSRVPGLLALYPGAVRTGEGVAIPLGGGVSREHVLAVCRARRIAVARTRLRYRLLEDILSVAARVQAGGNGLAR